MTHVSLHATITKYSHHFTVKNARGKVLQTVYKLSSEYTQHGLVFDKRTKRKRWMAIKTFGIYVDHGREFRFHIGQYEEFINLLNRDYVDPSSYEIYTTDLYEGDDVELEVQEKFILREDQEEAKEFVHEGGNCPLLMMATGSGKTIVSLVSVAERGKRFAVRIQAMYIDKWVADITDALKIDKSEICVIQGSDTLIRATHYPGSGLPMPKAFVISLSTMNAWYKLYEESMENPLLEAYGCMPYDFSQHLGIGTEIYDEAHQHPHSVYRNHCYSHVPKIITLTATLLTKDPTLRKVQSMMFPRLGRFDKIKMKKYITAHACAYQIVDFQRSKLQTVEWGQTTYSHTAFEKSILKNAKVKKQYLGMIVEMVREKYYKQRAPEDKLLVFVATKAMAEALVHDLKQNWPHLDIRKYLQENDYADILDPDICVTTIISGGTAIDIKNLRRTIMTISVDSPIANVQALGRLRELKHRSENADVHFYYMYCSTIPKQKEYHVNKVELLKDRVLDHKQEFLGTIYP